MTDERPILIMGEEMPTCPECGRRLVVSDAPIGQDAEGPIYVGMCQEHGAWRLQDDPDAETGEDTEDEGEEH